MTLYLVSWNVCGFSDSKKRSLLFQWTSNFEKHHPGSHVLFTFQETHTLPNQEADLIQSALGPNYSSIWSSFNSSSKGICIFTKKDYQLSYVRSDDNGKYVEGSIVVNGEKNPSCKYICSL